MTCAPNPDLNPDPNPNQQEPAAENRADAMAILTGGAADEGSRIKGAAEAEAQFEAKPLTEEERAAP